jgi:hypothetical protein
LDPQEMQGNMVNRNFECLFFSVWFCLSGPRLYNLFSLKNDIFFIYKLGFFIIQFVNS